MVEVKVEDGHKVEARVEYNYPFPSEVKVWIDGRLIPPACYQVVDGKVIFNEAVYKLAERYG